MGKYAIVQCNCPNRIPLELSRWGAYICGHKDGAILALVPSDLIKYGYELERVYKKQPAMFAIWRKIGDWRNYNNEYLSLSLDEAVMWQLEIEQLQQYLDGEAFMGWKEMQLWNHLREEEQKFYERRGYQVESVEAVLDVGLRLCRASEEMRKPIEFFW
jgi:hypothetical protein